MNAAIIFILLLALMLTGMPISISLGLTVLTFLFTMTTVPIESVALKLFTGIEKFEIMAVSINASSKIKMMAAFMLSPLLPNLRHAHDRALVIDPS